MWFIESQPQHHKAECRRLRINSLTTDATNNHNFSLKDNKGKVELLSPEEATGRSFLNKRAFSHSGMLMGIFFFSFFLITARTLIKGK